MAKSYTDAQVMLSGIITNQTVLAERKIDENLTQGLNEIRNLRKVQDRDSWGHLMKMTLVSDSLKLDCTRAIY
jgi:hypothetical protein